jgi:HAD superfamily hydrolase (TIGR01490 family)
MARRAALFDMDRTLIKKDSAGLYTRFRRDRGEATLKDAVQVAWWMLEYTLGIIDAPRVAKKALRHFAGKEERWLVESCEGWFRDYALPHVQEKGRAAVARHRQDGDFVAIVTGATTYVARPLARELGIEHVVCTELEVDASGRFTGRAIEPLCYGEGKLTLARRAAEREGFALADAAFYSDSITDLPLLEAVGRPIVVNPDARLSRVAKRRRWLVEHW